MRKRTLLLGATVVAVLTGLGTGLSALAGGFGDSSRSAAPLKPSDFGYPDATWTKRAVAITQKKIGQLQAQAAATPKDIAIRDRRILEHTRNLGGVQFALRMMERYTGTVDQHVTVVPGQSTLMQALQALPALRFYGEFFDFDTDCQSGTVWGTLGSF